jgi:hypothetical protein
MPIHVHDKSTDLTPHLILQHLATPDDRFVIEDADIYTLAHTMNVQKHGVVYDNCLPGDAKITMRLGSGPKYTFKMEKWSETPPEVEVVQFSVDEAGVKQGLWRRWVNGVVRETRMYKDGVRHGVCTHVNHKGQLTERSHWTRGYQFGGEHFGISA